MKNLSGMSLATDNVFGDDGGASQLATATGNVDDGYTVKLAVRVDTSTKPSGGGARRAAGAGRRAGGTEVQMACGKPPSAPTGGRRQRAQRGTDGRAGPQDATPEPPPVEQVRQVRLNHR